MKITDDVDLPEDLLTAATNGDLVLFVGAGASVNKPSGCPLFPKLAENLAKIVDEPYNGAIEPDAFLGQLDNKGKLIKEVAHEYFSRLRSKDGEEPLCNETHKAIIRLASACKSIRIVTTNYDEYLEDAAKALKIDLGDTYHSPVLPLGGDFTGIVHLHGQVSRPASEFVLTDEDFSHAYLIQGWARRFVTDLFEHRTVLFIGYSHDDSVMKYIARGLPHTKRFALTDSPGDTKWQDLRITAVGYPPKDDHQALPQALGAWATHLEMGLLDHRTRIHRIISGGPPEAPTEKHYLELSLRTASGAAAFAEKASGKEWLWWAAQQQTFRSLFRSAEETPEEVKYLAKWFVSRYVAKPELTLDAFEIIFYFGGKVCAYLHEEIIKAVKELSESPTRYPNFWFAVLSAWIHTENSNLEYSKNSQLSKLVNSPNSALLFLQRALQPRLSLHDDPEEPEWFELIRLEDRKPIYAKITFPAYSYQIKNAIEEIKNAPSEDSVYLIEALQILEQFLRGSYELYNMCADDNSTDALSLCRAAIVDPDEAVIFGGQDIDVVIDGLCDIGKILLKSGNLDWNSWLSSPYDLFRRLGLYFLNQIESVSAHEKLNLLLAGLHLKPYAHDYEVYQILTSISSSLEKDDRKRLLKHILETSPPAIEDTQSSAADVPKQNKSQKDQFAEKHRHWILTLLHWLNDAVPDWDELKASVSKIQNEYPDFKPPTNIINYFYPCMEGMEDEKPFTDPPRSIEKDFIDILDQGRAREAIDLILDLPSKDQETIDLTDTSSPSKQTHGSKITEKNWERVFQTIRRVSKSRPDIPIILLAEKNLFRNPDEDIEFQTRLIYRIDKAKIDGSQLAQVINSFKSLTSSPETTRAISNFCSLLIADKTLDYPESLLVRIDELLMDIWKSKKNDQIFAQTCYYPLYYYYFQTELPSGPNCLAQYWINRITKRRDTMAGGWPGLSDIEKMALQQLLNPKLEATASSLEVIAENTFFLFSADPDFTTEHIFPIFTPTQDSTHERTVGAWQSYLRNAQVDDSILDAGFWQILTSVHDLLESNPLRKKYWSLMASACIQYTARSVNPVDFLNQLKNPNEIRNFINALADELHSAGANQVQHHWNTWIAQTARDRLSRSPKLTFDAEKMAWGDLALKAPDAIALSALEISDLAPGPVSERLLETADSETVRNYPDNVIQAVTRRLEQTPRIDGLMHNILDKLVTQLREAGAAKEQLKELAEQALRLGHQRAVEWIDLPEA